MSHLTRRGREILEIAEANDGLITDRDAGRTELGQLVQLGYINADSPRTFRVTSAGTQAVRQPGESTDG